MSDTETNSETESIEINTEDLNIEYNYSNLDHLWSIKNTILYASGVYLFINMIYTIYNIWYLIPVFLLIFGVIGISKYNNFLTVYFFIYLIIKLIVDSYLLIKIENQINIVLLAILIIIKIYLCELTLKFFIKVCNLTNDELNIIKNDYIPNNRQVVLY
jgi:hypothetical protein